MLKYELDVQRKGNDWFGGGLRYETIEEARQEADYFRAKGKIQGYKVFETHYSPFNGYSRGKLIEHHSYEESEER